VFTAAVMSRGSNVTPAIPCLIGVKVRKRVLAAIGKGTVITVMGIKAIVYVPVEAGGSAKPRARANKSAADKPVRSVIAVGSAVIGGIVEVSIRADRRQVDTGRDLGRIGT
jgi:hypothetical protein